MAELKLLREVEFEAWQQFVGDCYGTGHVLTEKPWVEWYYGGRALVATEGHHVVGTYGVLEFPLALNERIIPSCWFVSGMVRPEYRSQGIGKRFVARLMEQYGACGVLGFNEGVARNYERAGFNLFGGRSARRWIAPLNHKAYELVSRVGGEAGEQRAQEIAPLMLSRTRESIPLNLGVPKKFFAPPVSCYSARTPEWVSWRTSPESGLTYLSASRQEAYVLARVDEFFPYEIQGLRIVDFGGPVDQTHGLLEGFVATAALKRFAFVEVIAFTDRYADAFLQGGWTELKGDDWALWPWVSSPTEYRDNHELICLGSLKYGDEVRDLQYEEVHFTRLDSDRDRSNRLAIT